MFNWKEQPQLLPMENPSVPLHSLGCGVSVLGQGGHWSGYYLLCTLQLWGRGGAQAGSLPFLSLHLLSETLLCKKRLVFTLGLLFIPLSCAHACRGLQSPLEELHRQPESWGWAWQWGLQKGFVQGGGLGINLKTRFCVSFPLE